MNNVIFRMLTVLGAIVVCGGLVAREPAIGAEDAFPELPAETLTFRWTLTPAAEPSPALRYPLLPDLAERTPGNAAANYLRAAVELLTHRQTREAHEEASEWYDTRPEQLPADKVRRYLDHSGVSNAFQDLRTATRCERCDWGNRFQDLRGRDVVEYRLEEFQQFRMLIRYNELRMKLQITNREWNECVAALRDQFQLAQNLGASPNLIVSLQGVSTQSIGLTVVGEMISTPGSPNLYWSLRSMPDPLFDLQPILRMEFSTPLRMLPFLTDADTARRSPDEWERLVRDGLFLIRQLSGEQGAPTEHDAAERLFATKHFLRAYPLAKRDLMAWGFDAAKIEAMPVGQVIAIHARECHRHVHDEYLKWSLLPHAEGIAGLRETTDRLQRDGYLPTSGQPSRRDPLLLQQVLMPAVANVAEAFTRPRRVVACLSVIEALRLHAAKHEGRLPKKLSDITAVPIPVNPATNKPFPYRVVNGEAELIIPPIRADDAHSGRRYLLRIAPAKP